jgi:hypothetical protein
MRVCIVEMEQDETEMLAGLCALIDELTMRGLSEIALDCSVPAVNSRLEPAAESLLGVGSIRSTRTRFAPSIGGYAINRVAGILPLLTTRTRKVEPSNTAAGFEASKNQFAGEARARGVSASTVAALTATTYSTATIAADRGQRSFSLSLDQFLAKRGGSAIVARGRALKQSDAALFASIQLGHGC